jgi:hypothetical protein
MGENQLTQCCLSRMHRESETYRGYAEGIPVEKASEQEAKTAKKQVLTTKVSIVARR